MQKFPLELILTVSAEEYCISKGKDLKQYELRGIHIENEEFGKESIVKTFRNNVPQDAEVVVGFNIALGGTHYQTSSEMGSIFNQYAFGTALIPKSK